MLCVNKAVVVHDLPLNLCLVHGGWFSKLSKQLISMKVYFRNKDSSYLSLTQLDVFPHLCPIEDHLGGPLQVPTHNGQTVHRLHLAAGGEHIQ